jgi:putative metallohydrolase (TIGR04338 family)
MATTRDNQKSRHYAAERFLYDDAKSKFAAEFIQFNLNRQSSIHDCQSYVNLIARQDFFRKRFGERQIIVESGRGGGMAYGSRRITLGTWARNEAVILHEMAHCLAPSNVKHGAEFSGIFLFLVKNVFGAEMAARLRESYKEHRVRYNNKAIPAINKNFTTYRQKTIAIRKQEAAAKRQETAKMKSPLTLSEKVQLRNLLKQAVESGMLGEAGDKKRRQALSIARLVAGL